MRALIVYESMFGNTRDVAQAIADGLRGRLRGGTVEVVEVSLAPRSMPDDLELLVVGGPTHAHGMTTAASRADAAGRAGDGLVSRGTGVREWLDGLPRPSHPIAATVFDTRIKGPELLWGSAAKGFAKVLGSAGFRVIRPAASYLVAGPTGPLTNRLLPGELDRARAWGAGLAPEVATRAG